MAISQALPQPARAFSPYLVAVSVLGVLVAGAAAAGLPAAANDVGPASRFALLAALVLGAELRPVSLRRGAAEDSLGLSGAFLCAMLLLYPWRLVLVVAVVVCAVAELRERVAWWKAVFNVGQYAVAVAAAAAVLTALHGRLPDGGWSGLPALAGALAACLVFAVTNTVLAGIAFALYEDSRVLQALRRDIPFHVPVHVAAVALAPVVAQLAVTSELLVPVMLVPVAAVLHAANAALARDELASHDPLTGLANEGRLRQHLGEQLRTEVGAPGGWHAGVVSVELHQLADVRRTLGASAADDLVRQVGDRLAAGLGSRGLVGRASGGGFTVVLPTSSSLWAVTGQAEVLLNELEAPYSLGDGSCFLPACAGLAIAPQHGTVGDELLRRAEIARDTARAEHRGLQVYDPDRDLYTRRRLEVLSALSPALHRSQLQVHFQPQVDLTAGRVTGYEALLRWTHPELGQVPPDEFVPLAEDAGLMPEVTDFVLDVALHQAAQWRRGGSTATVSVNVSASVLQDPGFPRRVLSRLASAGVPASALVLELTESAVLSDLERGLQALQQLRVAGVGLSLDDYGTAYASLAHLRALPVDELKIDKQFVLRMSDDVLDRAIVGSTLELGRALGLRVVAEGVATAEIADLLSGMGCRVVQGFHTGRPAPAPTIVEPRRPVIAG